MSTILDALRKVQRDRERSNRDLRGAITGEEAPQSKRGGAGRFALTALLVVLALGASAYLFLWSDGGETVGPLTAQIEPAPEPPNARTPRGAAAPPGGAAEPATGGATIVTSRDRAPKLPAVPDLTEERRARIAKAMRERSARERAQALRSAATSTPTEEGAGDAEAVEPAVAQALSQARDRAPAPAPPPLVLETASKEKRAPVARAAPKPPSPAPAPKEPAKRPAEAPVRLAETAPAPKPEPRSEPKPTPEPTRIVEARVSVPDESPTPEPSREEASNGSESGPLSFPDLRLETVRWHPDAARREARLLVDQSRTVDAREGDLVIGVAIERIDPGSVELKLGDRTKRIRIGR